MVERCTREGHPKYPNYGGRGIQVDPAWTGKGGFAQFLADMGERPEGRTLDREDPDGHYTPDNCRWATAREQVWNRRCMADREPDPEIEDLVESLFDQPIAPAVDLPF
jgi:hypothetical protein